MTAIISITMNPQNRLQALHEDPDLPSFQCDDYLRQLPLWNFVEDMYEGRSAWYPVGTTTFFFTSRNNIDTIKAARYLPQEHAEPEDEYIKRLARSYFDRKFADAINSSAGFLARFTIDGVEENIQQYLQNIDLNGNSLEVFLTACDIKALRDDHCFILVEYPKRPKILDAFTESKYNLRPYFVLIDARNVINWNTTYSGNQLTINQVTIKETATVKTGRFGSQERERFRVLTPGHYEIYEISEENRQGRADLFLIEEGDTTLDFVPLIPYNLTPRDSNPFCGKPPLFDIAELNLKLYQKQSEKDEAMHKANMAVLSVQELGTPGKTRRESSEPPIIRIGPNTCFFNLNASFVEPSGAALGQTQADIEKLELTIEKKTLAFQSGYAAPPTATEIARDSATAQASLGAMARAKESVVQRCFEIWALYAKIPINPERIITVNKRLVEHGMETAKADLLLRIRTAGEITRRSFLEALRMGEILDKDFDVNDEVEQLEAEMDSQMASQLEAVTQQLELVNKKSEAVQQSAVENQQSAEGNPPENQQPKATKKEKEMANQENEKPTIH